MPSLYITRNNSFSLVPTEGLTPANKGNIKKPLEKLAEDGTYCTILNLAKALANSGSRDKKDFDILCEYSKRSFTVLKSKRENEGDEADIAMRTLSKVIRPERSLEMLTTKTQDQEALSALSKIVIPSAPYSEATDPILEMIPMPGLSAAKGLAVLRSCGILRNVLQPNERAIAGVFSVAKKNSTYFNTFKDYCRTHPDSFLNQVCMRAYNRKIQTIRADGGGIRFQERYTALKEVIKKYLREDIDPGKLTLIQMATKMDELERSFQDDLRPSYVTFFDRVLSQHNLAANFGLQNYRRDRLENTAFLSDVIERFHNPANQQHFRNFTGALLLSSLQLRIIPPEIGHLTALTRLSLGNNRLETVPEGIGNLTALTELRLNNNQLETMPDGLGNLTALTELGLSSNRLERVPDGLGNLTALTQLSLGHNRLERVPDGLGNLTALTRLSLGFNRLERVPDGLGNLTALTELGLSSNRLERVPDGLGNLTALTSLSLGSNRLERVPDGLGNLTALKSLGLSNNQLKTLPEGIENLTALTQLTLGHNRLERVPEGMGNLTALTRLSLRHNQLETVPDGIGNLTALRGLWLGNNPLRELPITLSNIPNIEEVARF
ncbi:MAG: hypothetical protein S4CHLAM37_14920 [Chlamydiia bacterium]|nr:hypothetical protein [Chlamydiia bacterium]